MDATTNRFCREPVTDGSDLTVAALQRRCVELAGRIGAKAEIWTNIRSSGKHSLSLYTDGEKLHGYQYISAADGWDAAFAKIETWIEARPDPEAEWKSWGVAA